MNFQLSFFACSTSTNLRVTLHCEAAKQLDIKIPAPPSSIPGEERETYFSVKGNDVLRNLEAMVLGHVSLC